MSHRNVFILFTVLFFCGSLVFGAGSFFETANQAKETGKTVKGQDQGACDNPSGKGDDGNPGQSGEQGNDQPGNEPPGQEGPKDSPADHDNGTGNDDKADKPDHDKDVVDPDNPCDNPDVDPKGDCHPGKMGKHSAKDLTTVITTKFKVKVTVNVEVKGGVKRDCSWSAFDLLEIYRVLYAVPRSFVCRDFEFKRFWMGSGCHSGCRDSVCHVRETSCVHVCGDRYDRGALSTLLVREMARALFVSKEFSVLRAQWIKMFWKDELTWKIKPPFKHPCQTPDEDFGESVKTYWCCGQWLRVRDAARYEFVRRLVMKGRRFQWKHRHCGCDDEGEEPNPLPPASSTWHPPASGTCQPPDNGPCHQPATGTCKPPVMPRPPLPTASGTVKPPCPKPPVATCTPPVPPQNPNQGNPNQGNPNQGNSKTGVKTGVNTGVKTGVNTGTGTTTGSKTGGDHGASGKTDENSKNKDDNANKANNTGTKTSLDTGVKTGTGVSTGTRTGGNGTPKTGTATGSSTGTATGSKTGGDHGASGKTDENSKNKDDNANKANNKK